MSAGVRLICVLLIAVAETMLVLGISDYLNGMDVHRFAYQVVMGSAGLAVGVTALFRPEWF